MRVLVLSTVSLLSVALMTGCSKSGGSGSQGQGQAKQQAAPATPSQADVGFSWSDDPAPVRTTYYTDGGTKLFAGGNEILAPHNLQSKVACTRVTKDQRTVVTISVDTIADNGDTSTSGAPYDGYDVILTVPSILEKKDYVTDFSTTRMGIEGCFHTSSGTACRGNRKAKTTESVLDSTFTIKELDPLIVSGKGQLNGSNLYVDFNVNCGNVEPLMEEATPPAPAPALEQKPASKAHRRTSHKGPVAFASASSPTTPKAPVAKMEIPSELTCQATEIRDGEAPRKTNVTITIETSPKVDVVLKTDKYGTEQFGEKKFGYYDFNSKNSSCSKQASRTANAISVSSTCHYLANGGQTVMSTFSGQLNLDKKGSGTFETFGQPTGFERKAIRSFRLSNCSAPVVAAAPADAAPTESQN